MREGPKRRRVLVERAIEGTETTCGRRCRYLIPYVHMRGHFGCELIRATLRRDESGAFLRDRSCIEAEHHTIALEELRRDLKAAGDRTLELEIENQRLIRRLEAAAPGSMGKEPKP